MTVFLFVNLALSHSDPEIRCHSGGVPFHCHGTGMVSYLPRYPNYAQEEEDMSNLDAGISIGSWRLYHHKDRAEYTAVSPLKLDESGVNTSLKFTCTASNEVRNAKLQFRIHLSSEERFEAAIYDLPIHVFSEEDSKMQLVSERWFVFLNQGTLILQLTEDLFFESYGAHLSQVALKRIFSGHKAFLYVQDEGYTFDLVGAREAIEQVYLNCNQTMDSN